MADITSDTTITEGFLGNAGIKAVLLEVPSSASSSDTIDLRSDDDAPSLDAPLVVTGNDTSGSSVSVTLDQSTGVVTLGSGGEQDILLVGR